MVYRERHVVREERKIDREQINSEKDKKTKAGQKDK